MSQGHQWSIVMPDVRRPSCSVRGGICVLEYYTRVQVPFAILLLGAKSVAPKPNLIPNSELPEGCIPHAPQLSTRVHYMHNTVLTWIRERCAMSLELPPSSKVWYFFVFSPPFFYVFRHFSTVGNSWLHSTPFFIQVNTVSTFFLSFFPSCHSWICFTFYL